MFEKQTLTRPNYRSQLENVLYWGRVGSFVKQLYRSQIEFHFDPKCIQGVISHLNIFSRTVSLIVRRSCVTQSSGTSFVISI